MSIYCLASDCNGNSCRNHPETTETRFCGFHQYMNTYTEEQMQNLKICSGCSKWVYLSPECIEKCDNCLNVVRIKNEKDKKKRKELNDAKTPCSVENCIWFRAEPSKYCLKHKIREFVDETTADGKKVCYNYVRGCREQLEVSYKYSRCEVCLSKDREKDNKRREKFAQEYEEKCNKINAEIRPEEHNVMVCKACNQTYPQDYFIGEKGGITKGCKICREKNKIRDANRDKEHRREQGRKYDSKPERKEAKKKWDEENADKRAMTWMNYRQRQIETKGEEYWKKNAEQQKKWRENNPEKVRAANENKKMEINTQYGVYKVSANTKNIPFQLDIEIYKNIVKDPCFYCGIIQERGFNGIDRKYSSNGYNIENCVSCCSFCNYIKGSLDVDIFLKRILHILEFQKKIPQTNNLDYTSIPNHISVSYSNYKKRATNKNLEFTLTENEYDTLIKGDCYICGKQNNYNHRNGIDRVDNTKGYIEGNMKSCCCECNVMKKHFILEEFYYKLICIWKHTNISENIVLKHFKNKNDNKKVTVPNVSQNVIDVNNDIDNISTFDNTKETTVNSSNTVIACFRKKKTQEEKNEQSNARKQQYRECMREKYRDEEYKRMNAEKIAQYRKEKEK
jgi:hypothetical protein